MNRKFSILLAFLALPIAGSFVGYWWAQRNLQGTPPQAAVSAPGEKKPLYYYDPMYPQQKFDKPGKSPFMDMMLVPMYADDGGDSGTVKISARIAQNLGVRLGEASMGTLSETLRLVGAVTFDERAVTLVQARVNGYIEHLMVRAPLDPVQAGQPLAEILAPEWVAAQEEYLALRASPQAEDTLRQAARQRLSLLGMTEAEIREIEGGGKTRARVVLRAPSTGVIGDLPVREGMTVAPGAPLFRINGLSTVWINAEVPEAQAGRVKQGEAVEVTVPAFPGVSFKGRIGALLPEVNSVTRTLKARIDIANPKGQLAPGMYATVILAPQASRPILLVPSEAVIRTGTRNVVVVAEADADGAYRYKPTDVETGAEARGMTEIRSGLAKGAKVVLSGQFLIDSEANLKAAGSRMEGADNATEPAAKGTPSEQKR